MAQPWALFFLTPHPLPKLSYQYMASSSTAIHTLRSPRSPFLVPTSPLSSSPTCQLPTGHLPSNVSRHLRLHLLGLFWVPYLPDSTIVNPGGQASKPGATLDPFHSNFHSLARQSYNVASCISLCPCASFHLLSYHPSTSTHHGHPYIISCLNSLHTDLCFSVSSTLVFYMVANDLFNIYYPAPIQLHLALLSPHYPYHHFSS